jgi:hypothetical protein
LTIFLRQYRYCWSLTLSETDTAPRLLDQAISARLLSIRLCPGSPALYRSNRKRLMSPWMIDLDGTFGSRSLKVRVPFPVSTMKSRRRGVIHRKLKLAFELRDLASEKPRNMPLSAYDWSPSRTTLIASFGIRVFGDRLFCFKWPQRPGCRQEPEPGDAGNNQKGQHQACAHRNGAGTEARPYRADSPPTNNQCARLNRIEHSRSPKAPKVNELSNLSNALNSSVVIRHTAGLDLAEAPGGKLFPQPEFLFRLAIYY